MADLDWLSWSPFVWGLYALGGLHLVGFFVSWFRFERGERRARIGDAEAVRRFNRSLRGFPGGYYSKMLGKRPLDPAKVADSSEKSGGAVRPPHG
ncbi:MAG TPA: hypothetical protein VI796_02415 [Candidatus Thermoplasmatota archaeon]|nr:hypothetical protein [Candidatus Thermoplasmatota archaeon]